MIDAAIQEFNYLKDDNDEIEIKLDVVNSMMKNALERRGFEVKEDNRDRWIMGMAEPEDIEGEPTEEPKPEPKPEPEPEIKESKIF